MTFETPFVYVDMDIMEKNIRRMAERLKRFHIEHWPHIKTHKSVEIAKKQLEYGAKGITAAKLSEAEVMAEGGINQILIAYPLVGEKKLNRLRSLLQKAHVRTIADSETVAAGLSKVGESLGKKVEVLIEIDGGSHRGGVQPGQSLLDFTQKIGRLPGISIVGLFTYVGQIYGEKTEQDLRKAAKAEADLLLQSQQLLRENGFLVPITSGGSTPSSFHADQLKGITQSRAGNYVFNDVNALTLGVAEEKDCALRIRSTIVSVPLPGYATIDAGSKTLTSDLSIKDGTYGHICGMPDVQIVKLNEEHGYLRYDPSRYDLKVGDTVEIIPNHSCVIPNLNDFVYAFRKGQFVRKIRIDARGRNY